MNPLSDPLYPSDLRVSQLSLLVAATLTLRGITIQ